MASYRDPPTRAERAKAIAAVAALHLAVGVLVVSGSTVINRAPEPSQTRLIDIAIPALPPPPPPPAPRPAPKAPADAGKAGKPANPAPVVVPPPKLAIPAPSPLPTASVAGTGSAASAGVSTSGNGPGSGGSGNGSGGDGNGAGNGIGEDARLLSGGLYRRDYRRLRAFASPSGRAVLAILIGPDGRVAQCTTRQSSGNAALDATLCTILQPRMRWAPARDRTGRPLTVGIYYTATWSRD